LSGGSVSCVYETGAIAVMVVMFNRIIFRNWFAAKLSLKVTFCQLFMGDNGVTGCKSWRKTDKNTLYLRCEKNSFTFRLVSVSFGM
ncbi:MAG: hypothetical protein K2M02_10960, partial [Duncaniella sp.]|nr:hypothetical protein [Duncaniella sp.]